MREYESVFVLNPSVDDAQVDAELAKIKEFLSARNSEVTEIQKWGRRKLAYEVKKNREGIYTLIRFNADSSVPTELDRRYRLNENMLRYLTVLYERPAAGEAGEDETGSGEAAVGGEGARAEAAPTPEAKAAAAAPAPTEPREKHETTEPTSLSGNPEA
jgi:small subunit ribosomal protein S6